VTRHPHARKIYALASQLLGACDIPVEQAILLARLIISRLYP
jgi:hypothetical protein